MLDLTPAEIRELEAEFAKLTPQEQAMVEAAAVELERSIESMHQRLDETLEHLDRSFARLRATDFAREVFGDNFKASRWLLTPTEHFAGKTPMAVIEEEDGPRRVIEHLGTLSATHLHS